MMRRTRWIPAPLALLALLVLTRVSAAQDVTQEKATKIAADASYIATNGNTEVTTISGGDKLEHKHANWILTQEARAVFGDVDGVETAAKYGAGLRGDYLFSKKISSYGLGTWRRDVHAGVSQEFTEGLGLAWHVLTGPQNEADLEGGAGLLQRKDILHHQDDFTTARTGARYKRSFTDKAYFEGRGAYLFNLEDSKDGQANGNLALVAPIAGKFAIKLAYDVYFRNKPLPGFKQTDTSFSAGIQFAN